MKKSVCVERVRVNSSYKKLKPQNWFIYEPADDSRFAPNIAKGFQPSHAARNNTTDVQFNWTFIFYLYQLA